MFIKNTLNSFWCTCKKIIDFKGRTNRKEYLIYSLIIIFLSTFWIYLKKVNLLYLPFELIIILVMCRLLLFIISMSVSVRRMHDFNVSGWWLMFYIIITSLTFFYFVGRDNSFSLTSKIIGYGSLITLKLFLIFKKGTPTTNKYGEPPTCIGLQS